MRLIEEHFFLLLYTATSILHPTQSTSKYPPKSASLCVRFYRGLLQRSVPPNQRYTSNPSLDFSGVSTLSELDVGHALYAIFRCSHLTHIRGYTYLTKSWRDFGGYTLVERGTLYL